MAFHIIVIDDDLALQEFYRLLLEGEGYRVTSLPPFAASPSSITALHPNLIILDLLLGGKQSGWPILHALNTTPQTATLPILLATALPVAAFVPEWKKFVQRQNIPVLLKPFDVDALLAMIRSLLSDSLSLSSDSFYNESEC